MKVLQFLNDEHTPENSKQIVISGERADYQIVRRIAETATVRYYLCHTSEDVWYILSVAATVADNPAMERAAEILQLLEKESNAQETKYQERNAYDAMSGIFRHNVISEMRKMQGETRSPHEMKPTPEELQEFDQRRDELMNRRLHYDWLFPILHESFIITEQGKRRANVLEFVGANIADLMPLGQIVQQKQRVDLKTSAWIIGRMLKLLAFCASAKVQVSMTMAKFLLGPEHHHLVLLDWSNALNEYYAIEQEDFNLNISRIGRCGLDLLDVRYDETGWTYSYPYQENEEKEITYIQFLYDMAFLRRQFYRNYHDAYNAHRAFYGVVDDAWNKGYHPFTVYPVDADISWGKPCHDHPFTTHTI